MFELDICKEFSAAHSLKGYPGNCSSLHGHNWKVQVFVRSGALDGIGIALDFKTLKKELDAILAELDHRYLNDLDLFARCNPTSENLAKYIYQRLSGAVNDAEKGIRVSKVRVCESEHSGAAYFED